MTVQINGDVRHQIPDILHWWAHKLAKAAWRLGIGGGGGIGDSRGVYQRLASEAVMPGLMGELMQGDLEEICWQQFPRCFY